jgi:hypothetical protein
MLQLAVEEKNMIPMIAVVKSQYLDEVLSDKDFKIFMSNTENKEIKEEFKILINNAILERKLNDKLLLKPKEKTKKI